MSDIRKQLRAAIHAASDRIHNSQDWEDTYYCEPTVMDELLDKILAIAHDQSQRLAAAEAAATKHDGEWVTQEALQQRLAAAEARVTAAKRLAYAVALLIEGRIIGSRSAAADALLDYLGVGGPGGPRDVPTWITEYEAAKAAEPKKVGGDG